jgi:alpha-1,2-mannosyltransferase
VKWRRAAIWVVVVAAFVRAIDAVQLQFRMPVDERLDDLRVYLAAGNALLHGIDPYTVTLEHGEVFTYPPFAIALFAPLSMLPVAVAQWLVAVALFAVAVGLARRAPRVGPLTGAGFWVTLAVVLGSEVFYDSIRFGQVSLFLVLAVVFDATLPANSRWKGVLLGLTAAIKLTPLAIVPFLLVGKQYKMAARAAVAFFAASLLGFAIAPGPSREYWGKLLWSTARVGDDGSLGNFALRGTLERTVGGSISTSGWIGLALLFAGGLCWLIYRRTPARNQIPAGELVLVGGLASLVLSPITWTHHMGWMLAAVPLLWGRGYRVLAVASAVAMAVPFYYIAKMGYLGPFYEFGLVIRMLLCVAAAGVLASGVIRRRSRAPGPPEEATSVGSGP